MPHVVYRAKGKTADFVVLQSSPVLSGKAREYGIGYAQFRLLKTEPGCIPSMGSTHARGVLDVIENPWPCYYGAGIRSEGARMLDHLVATADKLATQ